MAGLGCIPAPPSRICAPNLFRIDVGVMPLTRPRAISNGVSLSHKLGALDGAFVAESRTVDPDLPGIINELSPNKEGIGSRCTQDDVKSGANELVPFSTIFIFVGAIVSLI
jgi:hypothetical protein